MLSWDTLRGLMRGTANGGEECYRRPFTGLFTEKAVMKVQ